MHPILVDAIKKKLIVSSVILISPKKVLQPKEAEKESFSKKKFPPSSIFQFPNIVSAILADFRGYDTLGETFVIFTAGLAVLLVLGSHGRKKKDPRKK